MLVRERPSPSRAEKPDESVGKRGAIAQLGERFNGIEEVVGSIPSGSTNSVLSVDLATFCLISAH
jgi:hypothetical protein